MTLHYRLLLRLEDIALRKVVVMLWNKMDVLSQFGFNDFNSFWHFKEKFDEDLVRVRNKLSKLTLPRVLINKAMPLTEIVELEIIKWIDFHLNLFNFPWIYFDRIKGSNLNVKFDILLEKLSWTSFGTINYQKTAEELIRCKLFDYFPLFKLACMYCLEDHVTLLWKSLPGPTQKKFYNKKDRFQLALSHLDAFWTSIFRYEDDLYGDVKRQSFDNIPNFYQHAFEVAANFGSLAATEYFYAKLTSEEKENSLLKTAKGVASKNSSSEYNPHDLSAVKYTDILCYLLSLMTTEKRRELFQAHPYDVSACFLIWPWQDLFLDVAQSTLEFLPENDYCRLLDDICSGPVLRSTKVDLFRKFFQRSPENLKSYFVDQQCLDGQFLFKLFALEELEIIDCIFRNIESPSKLRLALCQQGNFICLYLMEEDKWNLLNLFIEKAVLSQEHREQLKGNFMSYFSDYFNKTELRCKLENWERSFYLLNESE